MSVLSVVAAVLVGSLQIPASHQVGGYNLGCQAWSFSHFTAFEAIEKTAAAGAHLIEFYPGQRLSPDSAESVGPDMTPAAMEALRTQLEKYEVTPVAYGVTGISKDEAAARKLFEWARAMKIGILNTESTESLDTIEKMVKEYDIRVGFHDHPKNDDPNYRMWDPHYILDLVKNRDRRIGSCADTGHWVRSGIKPIDALRILDGRIISCHLKDLNHFGPDAHDVPFGTGVSDVPAILAELRRQKFNGSISIEYEFHWETSVPEIAQCVGFVRGLGAH